MLRFGDAMYLYVVLCMSPIPLSIQISQLEMLNLTQLDFCNGSRNLPGDEILTPPRTLVIKEDPIASVHPYASR